MDTSYIHFLHVVTEQNKFHTHKMMLKYNISTYMKFKVHFCCLNKTIPNLGKSETYSLFTVDYGLHHLYLYTTRSVEIQSYIVTKTFHRNMYDIKHVIMLEDMLKAML
jgi:hypothetical protein